MRISQTKMTVTEWIFIEDCPIQRNTDIHASKARNKHLKKSSITHQKVSMALLPGGKTFKLDGHTRAFLWKEKSLTPCFDHVLVDVYHVNSIDEVKDLYKHFDNPSATETSIDRLHGAFRLYDFHPKSSLVSKGGMNTAIYACLNMERVPQDIYTNVAPFIEPIKFIDKEMFTTSLFPAGIIAGMLATTYRFKDENFDFWRLYFNEMGTKDGKNQRPDSGTL